MEGILTINKTENPSKITSYWISQTHLSSLEYKFYNLREKLFIYEDEGS